MDSVKIANLALANLGQNQIMSLDDESQSARFCKTYYAQTLAEVLQLAYWSFAIKRVELSRLAQTPLTQWAYQYQLPSDYIRIIQMGECWWFNRSGIFAIEGGKLLTDCGTASIRYVSNETDANLFNPLFTEAFSFFLAAKVCKPLTGDANLAQAMRANAFDILGRAQRTDAVEQHPRLVPAFMNSGLVAARRSYAGGYGGIYWP